MCGRFTLTSADDLIRDLFELKSLPSLEPRYNIAPTQEVLAVRSADEGREALLLRWGLVPQWADDTSIGSRLINARSETVASKPAFRDAFRQRRCLVVADGFIEWQASQGRKQPYHVRMKDGSPFGFAGLWERWRDEDGQWLQTCTILTTEPNELVEPIHDRMPVILPTALHERWLDTRTSPAGLTELLGPFPAAAMEAVAVSTRVNSVRNDDPACLERTEIQGTLL
jgi:putative SOS response-associated peptidase YedK